MSHSEELKRVNVEIASYMGHLNKTMVYVLSLYVFGMVIMRHSGQSQIATLLSGLVGCGFGTMKQRLRELTYESTAKRGEKRQELDVKTCFAPLLVWVISKFRGNQNELVLALDATYLKDRFVILAVSVVIGGCAIPVAWHIQEGNAKGEWNPIWFDLLARLKPSIPEGWTVFALADSGLCSKALYNKLTKTFKWHVFMRVSVSHALFKIDGENSWYPLSSMVKRGMEVESVQGKCFKGNPIACTLILQWEAQYDHACLILSDLSPPEVNHNIYGIRYWIECGFKDIKRGLFHWEQTKMTNPRRVERLWLVMSIALLWLTALGEAALDLPQWQSLRQARPNARILSAPILGWIDFILTLLNKEELSFGYFNPYTWQQIRQE